MRFKARTLKYVYTVVFIVLSGLGATGSDYAQDFQKNSKYISIQSFLLIIFLYFLVAALHIYIFIFFNSRIRFFPTLHSSPFRYVFSNMLIIIRKCTYTHTLIQILAIIIAAIEKWIYIYCDVIRINGTHSHTYYPSPSNNASTIYVYCVVYCEQQQQKKPIAFTRAQQHNAVHFYSKHLCHWWCDCLAL